MLRVHTDWKCFSQVEMADRLHVSAVIFPFFSGSQFLYNLHQQPGKKSIDNFVLRESINLFLSFEI